MISGTYSIVPQLLNKMSVHQFLQQPLFYPVLQSPSAWARPEVNQYYHHYAPEQGLGCIVQPEQSNGKVAKVAGSTITDITKHPFIVLICVRQVHIFCIISGKFISLQLDASVSRALVCSHVSRIKVIILLN